MQLEQVKRKIPSVLFSWDTYSASREGQLHLPITLHSKHSTGMDFTVECRSAVLCRLESLPASFEVSLL